MSDGLIHKSSTGISILVKWIFALIIIFIIFKIFTIFYPQFKGDNIKKTITDSFSNSDGGPDPRNGGKGFFNMNNSTNTKNNSISSIIEGLNDLLNKLGIPKIDINAYSVNSTNTNIATNKNIATNTMATQNIKYVDRDIKYIGVKYVNTNYAPRDVQYVNTNYAPREVQYINLPR